MYSDSSSPRSQTEVFHIAYFIHPKRKLRAPPPPICTIKTKSGSSYTCKHVTCIYSNKIFCICITPLMGSGLPFFWINKLLTGPFNGDVKGWLWDLVHEKQMVLLPSFIAYLEPRMNIVVSYHPNCSLYYLLPIEPQKCFLHHNSQIFCFGPLSVSFQNAWVALKSVPAMTWKMRHVWISAYENKINPNPFKLTYSLL